MDHAPKHGLDTVERVSPRTSRLDGALENLTRNMDSTQNRIEDLYNRLAPVLGPPVPTPSDPGQDSLEASPLVYTVDDLAGRAYRQGVLLQDLLERLEV